MFKKFTEVERIGKKEVEGLLIGKCYVFPKLDGTNASIWMEPDGELCCGSRSRKLGQFNDNFDFFNGYLQNNKDKYLWLGLYPHLTLFGEYLKIHTIKDYRDEMWNKFWIFDVYDNKLGRYLTYDEYFLYLKQQNLDYLVPTHVIDNPSMEQLINASKEVNFGMKEGFKGEGIVIKNYGFKNQFGDFCYGKIVNDLFKEENIKAFGPRLINGPTTDEKDFADKYITRGRINKLLAKLNTGELEIHKNMLIPRFLETLIFEVITEEFYSFTKKGKKFINTSLLRQHIINKAKELTPELFGHVPNNFTDDKQVTQANKT